MTAPMSVELSGLGNLGDLNSGATIGHHADMDWCAKQGDERCVKAIEETVKLYYTTGLYNSISGTLRDNVNCYVKDTCNPSPEFATIIRNSYNGVLSKNLQTLMDGYIKPTTSGSDYTNDPTSQEYIDQAHKLTCQIAAAAGKQLPDCPTLTGGTSTQGDMPNPQPAPSGPNWLLIGGIAAGAFLLIGGAALFVRRSRAAKLRGLYGYGGFGGFGASRPWNSRTAARFNAREYPCR